MVHTASKSASNKPKVVIIGAGAGGIATAVRLAHEGYDVTVYEKNGFSGGRCSIIEKSGWRFDQGPSLYLMPKIFEQTFSEVGENINDHVKLFKCSPNYKLHFHDGYQMELSTDMSTMKLELEKIEPGSFKQFLSYLKEALTHYDVSINMVLEKNFERWFEFFHPKHLLVLLDLHIHTTMYRRVSKFFLNDKLRRAFTFQAMYMGMSPFDAPATYSLLQYTEFAEGIWYPMGGFHKVIEKLNDIATTKGVTFNYNKGVKRINVVHKKNDQSVDDRNNIDHVTGVTLEDETVVDADIVVCNADLVWAYNNLLPSTSYAQRLGKKSLTSSSFSFYWGMKQKIPQLSAHNVFLAEHYRESFDQIFDDYTLPSEPSFYIHVPSHLDPTAAPDGKEAVTVLIPTGCINSEKLQDFEALRVRARKAVIATIEKRLGITNFEDLIEIEMFNTPHIWADKFNIWNGSILGLSHTVPQVCWFRPSTRHAQYSNLFFVGASTHPGTGVPIVLYCARLVTDQIKRHWNASTMFKREMEYTNYVLLVGAIIAVLAAITAMIY